MKYFLVAGERSGDLHGGNLINAITKEDDKAEFRGFGGDDMQKAGMELLVHYQNLAFMGVLEVLKNLRTISGYLKKCKNYIQEYNPDVVILIDYGGFNLKMAKFCHEQGITVHYYISPKVWVWNQSRAKKIKRFVDQMYVIMPFEKSFYKKFDWDVDYVGNPVLDAVKQHEIKSLNLPDDKPVIAILPGSRKQELDKMLPVLNELVQQFTDYHFVVAAVDNIEQSVYTEIGNNKNVELVFDNTYDLLVQAKAAVVTSGTATLETALWKVPQVVIYKTSAITYRLAKLVIKVNYISLVNLIDDKPVVKELIQKESNPDSIAKELRKLVEDNTYRESMIKDYDELYELLDIGSASENTAKLIVSYLNK